MTRCFVTFVGTKSTESFSVNPIVVHKEREKLNNHQFLQLPPLVQGFMNEATVYLVVPVTLDQFEDQATKKVLLFITKEKTPAKMLPSTIHEHTLYVYVKMYYMHFCCK